MRVITQTLSIHRPEVFLVAALVASVSAGLLLDGRLIALAAPDEACWRAVLDPAATPDVACRDAVRAFADLGRGTDALLAPAVLLLPWLVGLALGTPIVARELETGTAALAWSLTGHRARWLAMRLGPMVLVALAALAALAWSASAYLEVAEPPDALGPVRAGTLAVLGRSGLSLVGSGLAALGAGALLGALLGRTLPALVSGAFVAFAGGLVLGPGLQRLLAERLATWRPLDGDAGASLLRLETGYRAADGTFLDAVAATTLAEAGCGTCPGGPDEWMFEHLEPWVRAVAVDAFPAFEVTHLLAGLAVGLLCTVACFVVVGARRPGA